MSKKNSYSLNNKIILREKGITNLIDRDTIIYIKCSGNISTFYTTEDKKYAITKTLKSFTDKLEAHGFLQANRQTIVNMKYVTNIKTNSKRSLVLSDKTEVKISRRNMSEFNKYLKN